MEENVVYLKFKKDFTDNYDGSKIEINFPLNRLNFVRQHLGIESVVSNLGFNVLLPSEIIERPLQINATFEHSKATKDAEELTFFNNSLNEYQQRAVVNIMQGIARPTPYIVFGPPGMHLN